MKLINKSDIKFKIGLTVSAGSTCEVTFNGTDMATIVVPGSDTGYRIRCSSLPHYFAKFKVPSLSTMERWSSDGIAKSMLGHKVEPDGYDSEGSPSWMLVAGII